MTDYLRDLLLTLGAGAVWFWIAQRADEKYHEQSIKQAAERIRKAGG